MGYLKSLSYLGKYSNRKLVIKDPFNPSKTIFVYLNTMIFNKIRHRIDSPENALIIIGIALGILCLTITPPFQVADEYMHFYRSFCLSEGQVWNKRVENQVGCFLPQSILTTSTSVSSGIPFNPKGKQNIRDIFSLIRLPVESEKRVFVNFVNVAVYPPIPYIPQAFGIFIGRLLGFSPLLIMYLGRLFNMATFMALVYLCIKRLPTFKWTLFLLALTPMSLSQASSLSADCITNAISFFLIGTFFRCAMKEEDKLNKSELILIVILSFLLALCKSAYLPIISLFLIIPVHKLGTLKRYLTFFLFLIIFSMAATLTWFYTIRYMSDFSLNASVGASSSKQLLFVINNPLNFVLATFKLWQIQWDQIISQFVGKLGWLDTELPGFYICLHLAILFFVSLVNNHTKIVVSFPQKIIIFSAMISSITLVSLLLYLSWTSVGAEILAGWQGRYLIPISPLFFMLLYNNKISLAERKISLPIVCYSLFSGALTIAVLVNRYYL